MGIRRETLIVFTIATIFSIGLTFNHAYGGATIPVSCIPAPSGLVNWWDGEEELACTFNFDTSLFSDATIDRLMLRYQAILEITARNPGLRLSQL